MNDKKSSAGECGHCNHKSLMVVAGVILVMMLFMSVTMFVNLVGDRGANNDGFGMMDRDDFESMLDERDEMMGFGENGVLKVENGNQDQNSGIKTYNDTLVSDLSFQFPDSWNVYTKLNSIGSGITNIVLSPKSLGECKECGGYFGNEAVQMFIYRYSGSDSIGLDFPKNVNDIIERVTVSGNYATVQAQEVTTLKNGTLTKITLTPVKDLACDVPGGCKTSKEVLVFISAENTSSDGVLAYVEYTSKLSTVETEKGWELIKSTLDFSKMK